MKAKTFVPTLLPSRLYEQHKKLGISFILFKIFKKIDAAPASTPATTL
jgi:hypothetical protein